MGYLNTLDFNRFEGNYLAEYLSFHLENELIYYKIDNPIVKHIAFISLIIQKLPY